MELLHTWGQATAPSNRLVLTMRHHPLLFYFLLAFGFTWGWQLPLFALSHQQLLTPLVLLGPAFAGFVMAGITEGRAGMVRLLRRVLVWRFGIAWYLAALLLLPTIWLLSAALTPAGIAAFRVPGASFFLTYISAFAFAFLSAFWVEEFGWRGFALPRLQLQHGPLLGTLILGSLWALWHLPSWAFFPSLTGAGTTIFSFTFAASFLGFVGYIVAEAILITWVFNHARGSILLAVLFHAMANASSGSFLALFPSLFPHPVIPAAFEIGVIVVAVLVAVATRGHLGYQRYLRELALSAPGTDQVQEKGEAGTSV